jgi:hypothetical protein
MAKKLAKDNHRWFLHRDPVEVLFCVIAAVLLAAFAYLKLFC